jgi:branched-chain amino acid transport system permease protein
VTEFIQNLIDGLGKGSTYALLAVGVSMLFGVMHLVNFAHGELLTVSAYVMYFMRQADIAWTLVIPVAVLAAVLLSVVIEFTAFRRVRSASPFTLLLTSFAIEILSHAIWRTVVSAKPRRYAAPDITTTTFSIGSLRIEWWDLMSIAAAVLSLVATAIILRTTLFGLSIRAAAEDFDAARLMGVKANRVISGAFAFAGLLAGIAGIFFLIRRGQADPRMGAEPLLKGVIAAAIGGLGSIQGAVVGGLALGVAEVYTYSLLPKDLQGMYNSVVFALIVILFVVRPQGLFNVQNAERV